MNPEMLCLPRVKAHRALRLRISIRSQLTRWPFIGVIRSALFPFALTGTLVRCG